MDQNYEWWLKTDLSRFAGKWIVIAGKKVVASGTGREIGKKLTQIQKEYAMEEPLVAKVPPKAVMII